MAQLKFTDLAGAVHSDKVSNIYIETVKDVTTGNVSYLAVIESEPEYNISKEIYDSLKVEGCRVL